MLNCIVNDIYVFNNNMFSPLPEPATMQRFVLALVLLVSLGVTSAYYRITPMDRLALNKIDQMLALAYPETLATAPIRPNPFNSRMEFVNYLNNVGTWFGWQI